MENGAVSIEDVPRVDLGDIVEADVRRVQAELGTDEMVVNVWEFDHGETMVHHSHDEQEEFYYVIEGEFEVKVGNVGETETFEAETGDTFAFGADEGRGYRCTSETGTVLVVGSPNVTDIDASSYTPFDEA